MAGPVGDSMGGEIPAWELTETWDEDLASDDPLGFPGYGDRLATLDGEAVRTGRTGRHVVVESRFDVLGGSMGAVVGERVTRAIDRATGLGLPVVCVTRSGGARMQEGMVSLLQMGRTAAALDRHQRAGLLSLAVHRSPTTGGVFASYGSGCDLAAVEDGATIGFAGPRVVADTTGADVAGRSHDATTAFAAGLVDAVIEPGGGPAWVEAALGHREVPLDEPDRTRPPAPDGTGAWAEVLAARHPDRPTGIEVAAGIASAWSELAGADPVVRAGLASISGHRVVVVATDRHAGDGRPRPAGYRTARRAFALADRLGLSVVTLVDTPGADPSPQSENGGIAAEIAGCFAAMAGLSVPTVAVCVGEGGSGGALCLAWADRLLIQRHAVFSVIGPEGAASILHRDAARAPDVAESLALTAPDLARLGVVDGVVGETAPEVRAAIAGALADAVTGERERRADAVTARALRRS